MKHLPIPVSKRVIAIPTPLGGAVRVALFCVGALILSPLPARAQSSGGSGGSASISAIEAGAAVDLATGGGDLMPKDTVKRCEDGAVSIGGSGGKRRDPFDIPDDLMDDGATISGATTVVGGDVVVLCQ